MTLARSLPDDVNFIVNYWDTSSCDFRHYRVTEEYFADKESAEIFKSRLDGVWGSMPILLTRAEYLKNA